MLVVGAWGTQAAGTGSRGEGGRRSDFLAHTI